MERRRLRRAAVGAPVGLDEPCDADRAADGNAAHNAAPHEIVRGQELPLEVEHEAIHLGQGVSIAAGGGSAD